ncbi:long neurotoxin homolog TA-bm16-like [Plectropomus leopardus]|uniref:long neurotoxin homolog TA-bm16-like n=1 Tax=Plectropomus leopardus TaxID=160734 RepID=UPI001C4B7F1E|nr:long neurotoxin homolog TA-bm16-like [Plectropomus leopardus]XP_042344850.1 long neurotoxin homolog TA-bm16-like [Plectropomus leopardus]
MKFFGVVILFMALSAACALKCHTCSGKSCKNSVDCPPGVDQCAIAEKDGNVAKTCMLSALCIDPIKCCSTDLCNSATPTASSILLLLVSSGIMTLFF